MNDKKLFNRKVVGIYVIIFGIFFLMKSLFPNLEILFFFLVFLAIISLHTTIKIMKIKKKKGLLVLSNSLFLISLFFLIYIIWLKNYFSLKLLWPVLGFFPGISLIQYYFSSSNKSPSILIPGLFIILLSFVLLLLANHYIEIDIRTTLMLITSSMFILTGLILVFKKNKAHKNHLNNKNES